jgi:hypothetical protein
MGIVGGIRSPFVAADVLYTTYHRLGSAQAWVAESSVALPGNAYVDPPAFAQEGEMASGTNIPNHFLGSLSPSDSDLLRPHLRQENLTLRSVLFRPEEQIPRVYFPTVGIISLAVPLSTVSWSKPGCSAETASSAAGLLSTAGLP